MNDLFFLLLGGGVFFIALYMVDMFKTKTSDCDQSSWQ